MTRELALWPAGASFERGDFDARVSTASVTENGPFSAFAGFDRILVVTSGAGLVLDHGAAAPAARVDPLRPYRFRGDWPATATLLAGPVADFNVITRCGRLRADVTMIAPGQGTQTHRLVRGGALLHVLAGPVSVVAPQRCELAAGDSLLLRDAGDGETIEVAAGAPGCVALLVSIGGP